MRLCVFTPTGNFSTLLYDKKLFSRNEQTLNIGVLAVGAVGMGAFIIPPTLPLLPQGQVPVNQPQPGTLGGGAQQVNTNPTAALALSLTPPGLASVAIFPPWLTPRILPAVAVIFSESEGDFVL